MTLKRFIIFYSVLASFSALAQELNVRGTDVFVAESENLGVYGGMKLDSAASFVNNGSVLLRGVGASFVNDAAESATAGKGLYAFQSAAKQTVSGRFPTSFYNVAIENTSTDGVVLQNNVSVQNALQLKQGLVFTDNNRLIVNNSDEKAIEFTDNRTSASYIVGTLERACLPSKQYVFPVGSAKLYNPAQFISSLHAAGNIQVRFLPDWLSSSAESINIRYYGYLFNDFVKDGAWLVQSSTAVSGEFDFNAAIFNFSPLDETTAGYAMAVKNNNAWSLAGKRSFIDVEDAVIQGDYIVSKKNTLFGVFAITYASLNNLKIVNVIETGRGKETRFVIPEVWKYEENQLEIYSQWGNQLLETSNYTNNFDFESYPIGTYYYTFHFTRNGKREVFKSFVEIVR